MAQYYAILTNTGLQKLAAAQANEEPLVLTEFAAGDGGGGYVAPGATWTSLENEVWRGGINRVYQSDTQADIFIVEGFIDRETGGFWVRELGVFDGDGDLIAVAASPETFKAAADDGAARDLYLRIMLRYANTNAVAFDVEPSQILARHDYVDSQDDQVRQEAEQMVIDHAAKAGGAHGVPEGEAIEWKAAAQQKADAAESAAKGYTDSELSSAASALQSYADSAASDAQQAAQGYTDSEIQSHESSRNHPNATTSQPGFMSSGDKSKLNGIEAGAQANPSTTASRTSTSTTTVLQAAGMNNHRTSGDHDGRYYTKAEVEDYADSAASGAQQAAQGYTDSKVESHEASRNHPNATPSQPGLMSSGDKSKLNGIESGAQVNPPTTASRTSSSTSTVLQAAGMNNHRTSGDHDGRYYTQSQIDSMISGVTERAGVWWDTLASELVISTNFWTNILSVTVPAVASNDRLLLIANINQRGGSNIQNTGFYRFTRNGSAVMVGTSGPGGMQATIAHGWTNSDRQIPGMMLGVVTAGTTGNVTIAVQCRSAGDSSGTVRINSTDSTGNNHARTLSALAVVRLRSQ
ncbi:MAG: phage tail protein [Ectothiorhodospiraceae bacterium]|nr:phage tail protein [Ectothiorhodospiraceae bacterium]